jgi:hypothetical protein
MSCEKYSGWMTDAALGELRPERERELLAHAVECAACREALAHARAVHALVDRGVQSLVAGEPSPQFASHLRRRIAEESDPPRSPWAAWAPVAVGAFALVVVLAIMVARMPRHSRSDSNVASAVTPVSAPLDDVTASAVSPQKAARTIRTSDSRGSAQTRVTIAALPEVIVPQGQLVEALQLSAAVNSGRVDGNKFLAAQQEYAKPLEVKPIEIAPLEIPALDDATEKPAGSLQF